MTAQTPDDAPIVVEDLVKRFDGRAVLDGINLVAHAGQTLVIMGGSGSGKSTLLRCMIGSIAPSAGSIRLFGSEICGTREEQLNDIRKRFGILFQSGALFNSMTLRQNVALPLQEHTDLPPEMIEIIVTIKLELVGLREHGDKYPAQISGGMKKRAGLARALALDPQILFYDEPSAGLDPVTSAQIDELIVGLTRQLGVTSVVVTHEMDSAFTIADRMAMLHHGRILLVDDRGAFEAIRDSDDPDLPEDRALIRQFLRGSAQGPLSTGHQTDGYAMDLLGLTLRPGDRPSLQTTRKMRPGKTPRAAATVQRSDDEPGT